MFRRLHELDHSEGLHYDVLIVGAGPAGLALASGLDDGRTTIGLLESGDLSVESRFQRLNEIESVGLEYDATGSRCRAFGGTTHWWVGACALPDPIDFERREWVREGRWLFPEETLAAYYERALRFLGLRDAGSLESERWLEAGRAVLPESTFEPKVLAFSRPPLNLGAAMRSGIEASRRIVCHPDATVTELVTGEAGTAVEHVVARGLDGETVRLGAGTFVICAGGLESARLLLLSRSAHPNGLGNDHDQVGRCFMEHLRFKTGFVPLERPVSIPPALDEVSTPGGVLKVGFRLGRAVQRDERTLNPNLLLFWNPLTPAELADYDRIVPSGDSVMRPAIRSQLDFLLRRPRVAMRSLRQRLSRRPTFRQLAVCTNHEQSANPSSRVTLSEERDRLGLPKLRLDWRLQETDRHSIERFHAMVREALDRQGLPGSDLDLSGIEGDAGFEDSSHPMGTTRMSTDPREGVVDADCRVHSLANLYVCSSSVFPRGGNANPTLTLVALAMRLADHLRTRLE